jgi:hypothetical protein
MKEEDRQGRLDKIRSRVWKELRMLGRKPMSYGIQVFN